MFTIVNIIHPSHHKKQKITTRKDAIMTISAQQRAQARNRLRAEGITLSTLCQENQISYQAARDLLCGKLMGHRGEAHKAAVFLGLKPNPKKLAA